MHAQQHLNLAPPMTRFYGSDLTPADDDRLRGQQLRIWHVMWDGAPRTLGTIARLTGDPEASISAQLRHLRKAGYTVTKAHLGQGLFEYRVRAPGLWPPEQACA